MFQVGTDVSFPRSMERFETVVGVGVVLSRLVVNPSSLSRPRFRRDIFARLHVVVQQISHKLVLLFLDFCVSSFRVRRRRRKVVLLHVSFQTINAMMVLRNKTYD